MFFILSSWANGPGVMFSCCRVAVCPSYLSPKEDKKLKFISTVSGSVARSAAGVQCPLLWFFPYRCKRFRLAVDSLRDPFILFLFWSVLWALPLPSNKHGESDYVWIEGQLSCPGTSEFVKITGCFSP